MASTDLEKKIDDLIQTLSKRNESVQEKKKSSVWGWVVGLIIAAISLVLLGVLWWKFSQRGKELAAAKTKLEQQKVDLDQKKHEATQTAHLLERQKLQAEANQLGMEIRDRAARLKRMDVQHALRKKAIERLNTWTEINEG
jgi:uncharacterized membrane-anchored protein YhcB (DUF1043 family)